MAIGDKYNRFTQYLQIKHVEGIDSITLTFPEIEKICIIPFVLYELYVVSSISFLFPNINVFK